MQFNGPSMKGNSLFEHFRKYTALLMLLLSIADYAPTPSQGFQYLVIVAISLSILLSSLRTISVRPCYASVAMSALAVMIAAANLLSHR